MTTYGNGKAVRWIWSTRWCSLTLCDPVVGGILFDTLFDEAGFLTLACVKGFLHGAGT